MIATVNLNFAVDIAPVFRVVPKGYDLAASTAVFELRDKSGTELYAESSDGITVETITLTAPLKYADGSEIAAGTEVAALRVAPALSSLPLGDPEHVERVQYRYGLRVDDAWTMQGWLTMWPDTGPAGCMGSPIAVCCGPQQIAVTVGSGPRGEPGPAGESNFLGVVDTSSRDLLSPNPGSTVFNTDWGRTETFDGNVWLAATHISLINGTYENSVEGKIVQIDGAETARLPLGFPGTLRVIIGAIVTPGVPSGGRIAVAISGIANVLVSGNTVALPGSYLSNASGPPWFGYADSSTSQGADTFGQCLVSSSPVDGNPHLVKSLIFNPTDSI